MEDGNTRRSFLQMVGASAALGLQGLADAAEKPIQGFEKTPTDPNASKGWQPISDRKIRVGIAGFGVCSFGAAFGFQNHPNVEIVAPKTLQELENQRVVKDQLTELLTQAAR